MHQVTKSAINVPTGPLTGTFYFKFFAIKCTKEPSDYASLFEKHNINFTVKIQRASNLFPKYLKELVEKFATYDFIVQCML